MPRRDQEPSHKPSRGGLRAGAAGGLQDGDRAGAQAGGETQVHQGSQGGLCQAES